MKNNIKKALLFSVCALLLFTGCSAGSSKKKESSIKVEVNKAENLETSYIVKNNDVILTVKNTGAEIIDYVSIDVAIFDTSKNLMAVEKQYIRNLEAGKENIIKLYISNDITSSDKTASKAEIALNKTNYETKVETSYVDKVSGTVDKTDIEGQLNLTISNTSGVTLDDVSASVVFYKNNQIVDLYSNSAQQVGESYSNIVYVPTNSAEDGTVGYIDYDDVKVIINNASKYIES